MDAFAVAVTMGLNACEVNRKDALRAGLYFGCAQAAMPTLGYFVGSRFADMISAFDHWIVFAILTLIGAKMIADALRSTATQDVTAETAATCTQSAAAAGAGAAPKDARSFRVLFPLAVATSIDALAVGVGFSLLEIRTAPAVCFIGVVTFCLSVVGYMAGCRLGARFERGARILGGVILIGIAIKILLEHLLAT